MSDDGLLILRAEEVAHRLAGREFEMVARHGGWRRLQRIRNSASPTETSI